MVYNLRIGMTVSTKCSDQSRKQQNGKICVYLEKKQLSIFGRAQLLILINTKFTNQNETPMFFMQIRFARKSTFKFAKIFRKYWNPFVSYPLYLIASIKIYKENPF